MGPLAFQMTVHILLMNLVAPSVALAISRRGVRPVAGVVLGAAAIMQAAALWLWHAPAVLIQAMASPELHVLMYGSLFATAVLFWWAVLGFRGARAWQPITALLATSKIYCLLAVLFVFAPRALYPEIMASHAIHGAFPPGIALADQQLAGLIMLAACPVTYLVAGLVIAARWLRAIGDAGEGGTAKAGAQAWT